MLARALGTPPNPDMAANLSMSTYLSCQSLLDGHVGSFRVTDLWLRLQAAHVVMEKLHFPACEYAWSGLGSHLRMSGR